MNRLLLVPLVLAPLLACAEEKEATVPEIPISIDFQSPAVAVAVENVQIFAYRDLPISCTELVTLRQAQQQPPVAPVAQTPAVTPCDLFRKQSSLALDLKANYTMLAVAQIAGQDVLVGCATQPPYGTAQGVEITLSFIDDRQLLKPQTCTKLSDKCNNNNRCPQ